MSYGFLTESSLIPKKAVPIKVDSSSALGLHAAVFKKEQELRDRGDKDADIRKKRGRAADVRPSKVDQKNAGVEERNAKDLADPRDSRNLERFAYERLLQKSKLYEKLAKRGLRADTDDATRRGEGPDGAFLVDFDEKVFESRKAELKARMKSSARLPVHRPALADEYASAGSDSDEDSEPASHRPSQDVEITDVFGRQVWVPAGSAEHKAYESREREQRCLVSSSMREEQQRIAWEEQARQDMEAGIHASARDYSEAGVDAVEVKSSAVKQRFELRMNDAERAALGDVIRDTDVARKDAQTKRAHVQAVLLGDDMPAAMPAAASQARKAKADSLLAGLLGGAVSTRESRFA